MHGRIWTFAIVGFMCLMVAGCDRPVGEIRMDSRTDACRDGIINALEEFQEKNMPFEVQQSDAEEVMDLSRISKTYEREGAQYTVRIGLDTTTDGGCALRAFEKTVHEGTDKDTSTGNFGTVTLRGCRCE